MHVTTTVALHRKIRPDAHRWLASFAVALLLLSVATERAAFAVEKYDLTFSTYLGGRRFDAIRDVAVDSKGNIVVVGGTASPDFPTTPGAYSRTFSTGGRSLGSAGPCDAFVAKFDPSGHLLWSTYVGGPNYDRAYAVEVDHNDDIIFAGRAGEGFPVTSGAFNESFVDTSGGHLGFYGKQNGFVAKISADGSKLLWASYAASGICRDVDVDDQGNVYIPSGWNGVGQAPTAAWFKGGYQSRPQGGTDTLVLKIASDGSKVLWGTYVAGSGNDHQGTSLRVDRNHNAYLALYTSSTDMPTPGHGQKTYGGGPNDFYVAKLTADGSGLVYGTYLGGSGDDEFDTHELAVDASGNAYAAVWTNSNDYPTTTGAFMTKRPGGPNDLAVSKIGSDGSLLLSTYLGGTSSENAEGILVDAAGNVYLTGTTRSRDFPTAGVPYQGSYGPGNGAYDANAFFAVLTADFSKLSYSSFMGRRASITGQNAYGGFHASALAADGAWIVAGSWHSTGFPTLNEFSNYVGGNGTAYDLSDAVLARFVPVRPAASDAGPPPRMRAQIRQRVPRRSNPVPVTSRRSRSEARDGRRPGWRTGS